MPRSGSNRLHTAELTSSGRLPWRALQPQAVYSALTHWPEMSAAGKLAVVLARNAAPRRFLDDHVRKSRDAWPAARAIGFKLFPYHSRRVLRHVCTSRTWEVLYLKRGNRLLQYASDRIARRTNVWTSTAPGSQGGKPERVHFSMRDFLRYVARLDHYDGVVRSALGGRPFLEIAYEDMDRSLPAIQELLGVEALDALESSIRKQNPDDWAKRFSNPDHVREALGSTEWAVHLKYSPS